MFAPMKLVFLLGFCLFITGCSQDGVAFKPSSGAGVTLYTASSEKNFSDRERYTSLICRNAGVPIDAANKYCNYSKMNSGHWQAFVYSGVYDIDHRCDAYLTWINNLRRSRKPIIEGISDYAEFSRNVLVFADVAEDAITIVSAVFGMARKSFTRYTEIALLTELDKSALYGPVLRNQAQIKEKIRGTTFTSKPQAMHALRDYLRTCMPYVIVNNVNATLSEFGKTGKVSENQDFEKGLGFAKIPEAGDAAGVDGERGKLQKISIFEVAGFTSTDVKSVQKMACISEDGTVGDDTLAAVKIIEMSHPTSDFKVNGKFSNAEWGLISQNATAGCDSSVFKNYYEFVTSGSPVFGNSNRDNGIRIVREFIQRGLFDAGLTGKTYADKEVREAIRKLKADRGFKDNLPGKRDYSDQLTPEFMSSL